MTQGEGRRDVSYDTRMSTRSHISLFTGAGGLDLGLERAGFTTLAVVEKDKNARTTLELNCGNFRYPAFEVFEDVNELTGEDLLTAAGLQLGEVDLLSGGPPCQSFSTAGHRRSMLDPGGSLIGRFLELVGEVSPRFFVLENVRGMLSAALKHRPLAERGVDHPPLTPLERLGSLMEIVVLPWIRNRLNYQLSYGLVNAANYGVPQVRQRVIFIGSRDHELSDGPTPPEPAELVPATHVRGPDSSCVYEPWQTLSDALAGIRDDDQEGQAYSSARAAVMAKVPAGKNWRFLRDNYDEDYLKSVMGGAFTSTGGRVGFWRRLSWDKPCPTLPTSPTQKATGLCHPAETRPLSVREYARVQQFPDDFAFAGSTSSKYAQIGNAVPVGLAEAIGQVLSDFIQDDRALIPSSAIGRCQVAGAGISAT